MNFENDAALGLSCTETTRNTAANKLYGKSFKDLSEAEKQFTLLSMVEDANKASGAIGQAARESDTWTNQLGNLKQAVTDLKAAAGSTFLQPAVKVLKMLTSLATKATKAIQALTSETGLLTRASERYHALVKRLQPAVTRMTDALRKGFDKGITVAKNVVERLGGMENVVKVLTVAVGAFTLAMSWGKIIAGAQAFSKVLGAIKGIFGAVSLKTLAFVAIVVVLYLLIDDFINFLKGNDSLIGTVFDKLGIGAENARQAIFTAFEKIKSFLTKAWQALVPVISAVWNMIVTVISKAWDAIYSIVSAVCTAVGAVAKAVFTALQVFWSVWGSTITSFFKKLWDDLGQFIMGFLDVVTGLANFISSVLTGDWKGAWEAIKQVFSGVWDMITAILSTAWNIITSVIKAGLDLISSIWSSIWNTIKSVAASIWDGIVSGVTSFVSKIYNGIVNGLTAAINWIKQLPSQAIQWGADIIDGIVSGITGAIGKVTSAVKGVADKIKSFLHFSVPDEGPLTDYESWMPDFMSGLAAGISSSEDTVLERVRGVANGIKTIMQGATASAGTALSSQISSSTSSMTQNVNINNSYSGGSAETQKNISRAMNKSAVDATTQMARGLAYARG